MNIKIFALLILFGTLRSQTNSSIDLLNSKYTVFKIKIGNNSNEMEEYDKVNKRNGVETGEFKMRGFIASLDQKDKNFKKGDTLIEYDWDLQKNIVAYKCISKYILKDSLLILYNINSAKPSIPNSKIELKTRKFKIVAITKDGFVLTDLDLNEVKREYYFKKNKVKTAASK